MLKIFIIIAILQIIFFIYAALKKTDKVTDLSYGLTFVIAVVFSYLINIEYASLFKTILLILVSLWGVRLSIYLFIRILKTGKDKRFDGVREDFKKFASFWLLQAVSIFIILLPTTYILITKEVMSMNWISSIGLVIALLGILIEGIADSQKYVFKSKDENRGKWISTGLWKYSRHPNYLGEIMMWVGVFVYCIPYINELALITILSPVYITFLLLGVSGIPTLEKEYEKRYIDNKEYQEYKKKTGKLLPKLL